uniref:Uncharacterized protein n=1 Tax=Arundo donax TaxID=35708 RepID=A0A0A8XXA2_ARUDO
MPQGNDPMPQTAAATSATTPSTQEPIENPDSRYAKNTVLRIEPPGGSGIWPATKKPKRSNPPRKNRIKKWGDLRWVGISGGVGSRGLSLAWGFAVISNGLGGVEGE